MRGIGEVRPIHVIGHAAVEYGPSTAKIRVFKQDGASRHEWRLDNRQRRDVGLRDGDYPPRGLGKSDLAHRRNAAVQAYVESGIAPRQQLRAATPEIVVGTNLPRA